MIPLTSPDPVIQRLMQAHPLLVGDLEDFIVSHKYATRKVMPGWLTQFLDNEGKDRWSEIVRQARGNPESPALVLTPAAPKTLPPPETAAPAELDLLAVIANAVKARNGHTPQALDEARVTILAEEVIETYITEGKLATKHTIHVQDPSGHTTTWTEGKRPPVWFARAYKNALCHIPTLLVGPRGCGKTTTGQLLAGTLGLPFYCLSLSAGVDEGIMQGWLHPSKEGFYFEYVLSQFGRAYSEGGVVLLDEIDAADANMLLIANAPIDQETWHIPLRHDLPPLKRHPNFHVIAAANTHGFGADRTYVGRNQLDGATLDRFSIGTIQCDYDEDLERDCYHPEAVEFGQRLRARCRAQAGFSRDVSTRNIAQASARMAQGTISEAWYGVFSSWSQREVSSVGAVLNHYHYTAALE